MPQPNILHVTFCEPRLPQGINKTVPWHRKYRSPKLKDANLENPIKQYKSQAYWADFMASRWHEGGLFCL
ncbi:hypothetical protein EYF80_026346 [Liparis tanakae]|uniref:Uncharacterized protein n=1 Tax=Liparis tanakae TaxID=230148 RepID=A0A4Z2HCM2_9TELE|nr:hypothetical protein EYF80_026346 [Liparis tanakae]